VEEAQGMNARRNNRWKLVAIASLFALPVLAAFVLHQAGYEPRAERNHGTLLDPPQDFRAVVATDARGATVAWNTAAGVWHVLLRAPSRCDAQCVSAIDGLHRIWIGLGRKAARVEMLYVGSPDAAAHAALATFPQMRVVALAPDTLPTTADGAAPAAWAVDPNGWLVLRYDPGFDSIGLRSDLKRVIR
jgi:hypothetical protein